VCAIGGDGNGRVGTPYVAGASVTATVVRNEVKGTKVTIGKFRRRKNSRRKTGFRARYTEIQIEAINA
jgi:large subunit ribosomal protein L21